MDPKESEPSDEIECSEKKNNKNDMFSFTIHSVVHLFLTPSHPVCSAFSKATTKTKGKNRAKQTSKQIRLTPTTTCKV